MTPLLLHRAIAVELVLPPAVPQNRSMHRMVFGIVEAPVIETFVSGDRMDETRHS